MNVRCWEPVIYNLLFSGQNRRVVLREFFPISAEVGEGVAKCFLAAEMFVSGNRKGRFVEEPGNSVKR